MKIFGYVLIGIGILDFALSWISDDWNDFVYNLVGEDLMQFTAIILVVIGSFISKMGGGVEESNEEIK